MYQQNNNESTEKEVIEWLVLSKEDDKMLVISRYALDRQQYNTPYSNVTWETCSLRIWLHGTFINDVFTPDEQKMIQITSVAADKNPSYYTSPGNNTTNKVFLLSITEANKYFSSDIERKCIPTEYAIAQGAFTSNIYSVGDKVTCWWWLRSPGNNPSNAANVSSDGSVNRDGLNVNYFHGAVRPAIWINLGN